MKVPIKGNRVEGGIIILANFTLLECMLIWCKIQVIINPYLRVVQFTFSYIPDIFHMQQRLRNFVGIHSKNIHALSINQNLVLNAFI